MIEFRTAAVVAAALVLALSGCKRKEEAAPGPKGPDGTGSAGAIAVPADAAAPLSFAQKSEHAEVELKLPEAVTGQPDLHARLYGDGVKELKAFLEGAQADRAELVGEGVPVPTYSRSVEWRAAAETGKLLSLEGLTAEYTGGAHGNSGYAAVLWDKSLQRAITPSALFRANADWAALDAALCRALEAEKTRRLGQPFRFDASQPCPSWRESAYVLAPSAVAGKAGGLTFLYGPYALGAYAEGSYEVTVPLAAFQAALAPAYADEFAGAPKPRPQG
ncbi:MAG TPA: DUF4163 domain-containing protein [Caulobacteraceae bacterium]|nr:DUF4163 domain-containing protein [Caulobacteraceae bacterium]